MIYKLKIFLLDLFDFFANLFDADEEEFIKKQNK